MSYRAWKDRSAGKRASRDGESVVILGAGNAAVSLLKELSRSAEWRVVGLLDDDPRMGYAIQSKISQIYFKRYVEATNKLQAIVMNLPLEAD